MALPTATSASPQFSNLSSTLETCSDKWYFGVKNVLKNLPSTISITISKLQTFCYNCPLLSICFLLPLALLSLPAIFTFLVFSCISITIGLIIFSVIQGGIMLFAGSILFFVLCGITVFVGVFGTIGFVTLFGVNVTKNLVLRLMQGGPLLSEDWKKNVGELKGKVQGTVGQISDNWVATGGEQPYGYQQRVRPGQPTR